MKKIRVHLKEKSYDIVIGKNALGLLPKLLKDLCIGRDAFIITNAKIKSLCGKRLEKIFGSLKYSIRYELIPDSEKAKSTPVFIKTLNKLARYDRAKQLFIVSLGGGVVGDLAGFVASVYRRGMPYIQIPTTLLSQVDSAIGGKVAVDLPIGKNLIGSFYQPRLVVSDISFIESLPVSELRNGLAEVVKYGIIKDYFLFSYIEKNYRNLFSRSKSVFLDFIIYRCSRIKADIVSLDETDKKDIRIILNYGHTIGHAIETAGSYKKYSHGEAVAIGMVAEAYLSYKLGHLSYNNFLRIETLLKNIGLPVRARGINMLDILKAQEHDKKVVKGVNRFALPTSVGGIKVYENIPMDAIKASLDERIIL